MQAFGILGFLINIVILGMEVSASASETIAEGHKAEIYKELAEKDILTKGYNRNAYNEDIRHKISGDNTYPVMPNIIRNWMQTLTRPDAGRMYQCMKIKSS